LKQFKNKKINIIFYKKEKYYFYKDLECFKYVHEFIKNENLN